MEKVKPYAKAVLGLVVPIAGQLLFALSDNSKAGDHITQAEWIAAILTGLASGGIVFGVPNKDPRAQHQDESVQPPQAGYGALELLVVVVVIVILVVLLLRLV